MSLKKTFKNTDDTLTMHGELYRRTKVELMGLVPSNNNVKNVYFLPTEFMKEAGNVFSHAN